MKRLSEEADRLIKMGEDILKGYQQDSEKLSKYADFLLTGR